MASGIKKVPGIEGLIAAVDNVNLIVTFGAEIRDALMTTALRKIQTVNGVKATETLPASSRMACEVKPGLDQGARRVGTFPFVFEFLGSRDSRLRFTVASALPQSSFSSCAPPLSEADVLETARARRRTHSSGRN